MEIQEYIDAKLVHSVHTSMRKSFRGCRRRWDWIFNGTYYPRITAKPLEFGVAYHKAMETYFAPSTWETYTDATKQALAVKAFKDVCDEQLKAYKVNFEVTAEVQEDYDQRRELGFGMLGYFFSSIAPEFAERYVPIGVEVKFEVPITSPDGEQLWCKCDMCWGRWCKSKYGGPVTGDPFKMEEYSRRAWIGLPVTYGGRLDLLVYDRVTERYYILDWKTAARLGDDAWLRGEIPVWLNNDDQVTSYVWALRMVLGIDIAGFIYWEQYKGYPIEPEPHKSGRRYKGCLYSQNKQMDTSYEVYLKTVSENDVEAFNAGLYNDYLEYLQGGGKRYHAVFPVDRTTAQLESAGRNIWLEAADMVDPGLRIYPSAGRFSCSTCAFAEPCRMKDAQEDYLYTLGTQFDKRGYHYWESEEKTTESKGRVQ